MLAQDTKDEQCHPVINVDEMNGKSVGKRKPRTGLSLDGNRKADMIQWRESMGGVGIPKGVYRFHSHEEADQWMIQQIAKTAAARTAN